MQVEQIYERCAALAAATGPKAEVFAMVRSIHERVTPMAAITVYGNGMPHDMTHRYTGETWEEVFACAEADLMQERAA